MNDHERARRYLAQLREQTPSLRESSDLPQIVTDWMLRNTLRPDQARDPKTRAMIEKMNAIIEQGGRDEMTSYFLNHRDGRD